MPALRTLPRVVAAAVAAAVMLALPAAGSADDATFANPTAITIPSSGAAGPYPSTIAVAGLSGRVTSVQVQLTGLTHAFPQDLDIMVRSPSGRGVMLMSDTCGSGTLTFDDRAAAAIGGGCTTGTWRPFNSGTGDVLPGDGGSADGDRLATFNGEDPNGDWDLYVFDDLGGDAGSLSGWSLRITTGDRWVEIPAAGPAAAYPVLLPGPVSADGMVADGISVSVQGLFHDAPQDLDLLLQGPAGEVVPLMSDACGGANALLDLTFTDTASTALDAGGCTSGTYRATDLPPSDTWPAGAPAATGDTLADFRRTDPRGVWRLYVVDDTASGSGSLADTSVSVTTTPARPGFPLSDTVLAAEGGTASVRIVRLGQPAGPATVTYATEAGTATGGADFTPSSGTVAFARDQLVKRIEIPIADDGVAEGEERFDVRLLETTGDIALERPAVTHVFIPASAGAPSAPGPSTPVPADPATPCADLGGAAKTACLRKQRAAKARAACLRRYRPGPRRAACLRTAARIAAMPARR